MLVLNRVFVDNEHYSEKLGSIGDAFVEAMFWLYRLNANTENHYDYCLDGVIQMPDFMTCVYHLINISQSKQPRASINDFVNDFRTDAHGNRWTIGGAQNRIFPQGDNLICSCVDSNIIEATLWSALVFWTIHAKYSKNKLQAEKAQKARNVLYEALRDCTCLIEEAFAEHVLIKNITPTLKRFGSFLSERKNSEQNINQSAVPSDNKTSSTDKDTEIIALQNQNINLKKELASAKEELAFMKEQGESITPDQKVILELVCKLLEGCGANLTTKYSEDGKRINDGRKMRAAEIANTISQIPLQTCKNHISNRNLNYTEHEEMIKELNKKLEIIGITWQL